jgi:hypothetical protein
MPPGSKCCAPVLRTASCRASLAREDGVFPAHTVPQTLELLLKRGSKSIQEGALPRLAILRKMLPPSWCDTSEPVQFLYHSLA